MNPLASLRQKFVIVLAILAVVNITLGVYLLWPGRPKQADLRREESELRQQYNHMTRESPVYRGMDQKLIKTREDVKKFYSQHVASFWSEVSEEINKVAKENGFAPPPIKYKTEDTGLPGLQRVKADITLAGEYHKVAKFINALERDRLVFNITQITLNGDQSGGGNGEQTGGGARAVDLQIRVDTFLKVAT